MKNPQLRQILMVPDLFQVSRQIILKLVFGNKVSFYTLKKKL